MSRETQISARVSKITKDLLEEYLSARGLKQAPVVESAILFFLRAAEELPPEIFIPPRVVLSEKSAEQLAEWLQTPRKPSRKLRRLLSAHGNPAS